MVTVAIFAAILLVAVLLSELAERTILSTAVLFLIGGLLMGSGVLGLISLKPDSPVVASLAELALFSVLFTDGMRLGVKDLLTAWKLPGRALLLGMPLTFAVGSGLAHWLVGLTWPQAMLVGAVLSPTDPVFAAAIVGREEIPRRLRHLLNVESGLNDGLALPVVVVLLAMNGQRAAQSGDVLVEILLGLALGIGIPWIASWIEGRKPFSVSDPYGPLFAFAVGLLVLSTSSLLHANEFLAAFAAGITMASVHQGFRDQFHRFGENVTELLKLAALLVFGALISPAFLASTKPVSYLFAALMLVAVRPMALLLSLIGSRLNWRERIVAAWFGPKGFASVTFGLMILKAGVPDANELFHLCALVIFGSIVAHSSTDVVIARWFSRASKSVEEA